MSSLNGSFLYCILHYCTVYNTYSVQYDAEAIWRIYIVRKKQIVRASIERCYIIEDYSKTLCKNMHFTWKVWTTIERAYIPLSIL